MHIREAAYPDLEALLALYTCLHQNTMPPVSEALAAHRRRILDMPGQHILCGLTA